VTHRRETGCEQVQAHLHPRNYSYLLACDRDIGCGGECACVCMGWGGGPGISTYELGVCGRGGENERALT
jgi:hypothetical protein